MEFSRILLWKFFLLNVKNIIKVCLFVFVFAFVWCSIYDVHYEIKKKFSPKMFVIFIYYRLFFWFLLMFENNLFIQEFFFLRSLHWNILRWRCCFVLFCPHIIVNKKKKIVQNQHRIKIYLDVVCCCWKVYKKKCNWKCGIYKNLVWCTYRWDSSMHTPKK